jgi:hypothetical protein
MDLALRPLRGFGPRGLKLEAKGLRPLSEALTKYGVPKNLSVHFGPNNAMVLLGRHGRFSLSQPYPNFWLSTPRQARRHGELVEP